jgi:hypothetical protein
MVERGKKGICLMIDCIREDINQDAQIAHLRHEVEKLTDLVNEINCKLNELSPVVYAVGAAVNFADRVESIVERLEAVR